MSCKSAGESCLLARIARLRAGPHHLCLRHARFVLLLVMVEGLEKMSENFV